MLGSLVAALVAIGLALPSLAAAEPTDFYKNFDKCPTSLPEMNDPATEEAACFTDLVRHAVMKVGNFEETLTAPVHLQFAVAGVEGPLEDGFVHVVPGSTTIEAPPIYVENPFATPGSPPEPQGRSEQGSQAPQGSPPAAPAAPPHKKTKKKRKKRAQKKKRHHRHKRHGKKGRNGGAKTSAADTPQIAVMTELAGDVREFNLIIAATETPGIPMKLPVKFHLVGEELGNNCYLGSEANPIVIVPDKAKPESSFFFGHDPNGFPIEMLGAAGTKLEDTSLTVPGATGCGIGGIYNAQVNDLIGLPALPGESRMVFGDNLFEYVGAGYDGTAPEGGAELQAAMEASRH